MANRHVDIDASDACLPEGSSASDAFDSDEARWWQAWREAGNIKAQEKLISHYLPYARTVAASYYGARYHDEVQFEDYLQFASVGLLEALNQFDTTRGVQFKTFAARRMHGAILNGLERFTEKQQQIATRKRILNERREAAKKMARDSAETGGARAMSALFQELAQVGIGLALSWLLADTGMVAEDDAGKDAVSVYSGTELRQLQERIRILVRQLPKQEQVVIRYHYLQGIAFEEIASMLGLTKGRISQIHRKALTSLRDAIKAGPGRDVFY